MFDFLGTEDPTPSNMQPENPHAAVSIQTSICLCLALWLVVSPLGPSDWPLLGCWTKRMMTSLMSKPMYCRESC